MLNIRVEHPGGETFHFEKFNPWELENERIPVLATHVEFSQGTHGTVLEIVYTIPKPEEDEWGTLRWPQ